MNGASPDGSAFDSLSVLVFRPYLPMINPKRDWNDSAQSYKGLNREAAFFQRAFYVLRRPCWMLKSSSIVALVNKSYIDLSLLISIFDIAAYWYWAHDRHEASQEFWIDNVRIYPLHRDNNNITGSCHHTD